MSLSVYIRMTMTSRYYLSNTGDLVSHLFKRVTKKELPLSYRHSKMLLNVMINFSGVYDLLF